MKTLRTLWFKIALIIGAMLMLASTIWAAGGAFWPTAGNDRENTRYQKTENKISPQNVQNLAPSWVTTTGGDVSATPAVDGQAVYFPDWAGDLYKLDRDTGAVIWQSSISAITGITDNFSRATPALDEGKLFLGDQGGRFGAGAHVLAFDAATGAIIWVTSVDSHPFAVITQSAAVFDGVVYVGVASVEESAAVDPGYACCSFQGKVVALDAATGQILWITKMAPEGYSGNAVWGGMPVIDTKRKSLYITTGNNYSAPSDYLACVAAAGNDDAAKLACNAGDNLFDSIIALDLRTGAVKWATHTEPFDTWNFSCSVAPSSANCPDPAGTGYDFAQAPILYTVKDFKMDLLGAGAKSGRFWVVNPDSGQIVWVTNTGPGGQLGGLMWGSAYDGERIYTPNANSEGQSWTLLDGTTTTAGLWTALDPTTGEVLWQTADPSGSPTMGAVSAANGLVYACSMDPTGHMYALDGATGSILWSFSSGGSCNAGPAIVKGTVYWGSGYGILGSPYTSNDKFFAFTLP